MYYIGSKKRLLPFIKKAVFETVGTDLKDKIFCDLFAGTGIVGKTFQPLVKIVLSNDKEYFSYVVNKGFFTKKNKIVIELFITILNVIKGKKGFIFNEYSENGKARRLYFSEVNGQKIDSMRQYLEHWRNSKIISKNQYYYLLGLLINSADKVANTTAVYSAYLKKLKPSAQKKIIIRSCSEGNTTNNRLALNEDANILIKKIKGDILYIDPPYNGRHYSTNYHLLNTIAKYKPFKPKGVTGLPECYKSDYCKKTTVKSAFEQLIKNAEFKYIFVSYNNEGLMSETEIKTILEKYGKLKIYKQPLKRFKSNMHKGAKNTIESIYALIKN